MGDGMTRFMSRPGSHSHRILVGLLVLLFASAVYLYGFPQANLFYAGVVLLHAVAGVVAAILVMPLFWSRLRQYPWPPRIGWVLLGVGAAFGLILIYTGTLRSEWKLMYFHILFSLLAVGFLFAYWLGQRGWMPGSGEVTVMRTVLCCMVLGVLGGGLWYVRENRWRRQAIIQNPAMPPATMDA